MHLHTIQMHVRACERTSLAAASSYCFSHQNPFAMARAGGVGGWYPPEIPRSDPKYLSKRYSRLKKRLDGVIDSRKVRAGLTVCLCMGVVVGLLSPVDT